MSVLIVDDEKLARERLVRMVTKINGFTVLGEASDGAEAISKVKELKPEIVLLDIRMPGMDGIQAARLIGELPNPPAIVFCTAYGEHALEAFEANAVGYLLKPVKADALEKALQQARRLTQAQMAAVQHQEEHGRQHISSKTRLGMELIPVDDVRCFVADHKYVTVYSTHGEKLIDDTLKELEDEFGERFVRVHRNALVSLKHIEGLERIPLGQFCVRLQGLAFKPVVSRRHVTVLRKMMQSL